MEYNCEMISSQVTVPGCTGLLAAMCQWQPAKAKTPASGNVFWKSNAWKRQVITDIAMLPRQEMFKPAGPAGKLHMDAALTDIQEHKQVT